MKKFSEHLNKELTETSGDYKGKEVDLDNPFRLPQGSDKKFGVYVKNPKTDNVIMVKFGDPNLSIKRDSPDRLKNFRSRHSCDEKTDKTTPGYWSCKFWEKDSPVSKLLSKGDVTEGWAGDVKGWVNLKTKKAYITKRLDFFHVQMIVMKPKDFGLTEKQILLVLEMQNEAMDAPDPEIWARKDYKDLVSGDVDVNKVVEHLAMKKGWYRVVGGKYGEISGIKIDDKVISACLNIMEDEGVIPYDGEGVSSIWCQEYRYTLNKDGPDVRAKSIKVLEGDAITRALRGKTTGSKRTDIGRTMSMFRGESLEISHLDEGIDSLKGWVNPKTKKVYSTRKIRPYHVEFVVKNPKDFGLTKKQILDYLEKFFDSPVTHDIEQSAKQEYEDIITGRVDINRGVELLAMKKGWYRCVGGKFASIGGANKLNDKQVGIILNMMEDEGIIGAVSGDYTQEVGLEYYEDRGLNPRIRYYDTVDGPEMRNLLKGKPRGAKRTEIGQNMAMFRGESFEISQLDEVVDPKDMLRIFNDLDKGDSIKVKFKSTMATASKNFVELIVTSGRRTVGKSKVERIILKSKKNPGGMKYFLYRRGDNVSFAMGDMSAIIDEIDESYQMVQEGIKDKLVKKLMGMTPVAKLVAKNPKTTHLAMSLLAIPVVSKLLDRANYDNLQKVIDISEFLKDTLASLGAEKDPSMCESKFDDIRSKGEKLGDDKLGRSWFSYEGKLWMLQSGNVSNMGDIDQPRNKKMLKKWLGESVELTEASFGHTLWIDPKGKVYDMNSRKEITDPKGHPYTHYDWVNANFTKYFGKSKAKKNPTLGTLDSPPPDKSGDVYDTPMEMGWARVRNGRVSLDVEVKLSKLNRSQKKVIRDIVDTDHTRPLYIDIWKKNKTSRTGDLGFQDYDAIVDFLSEEIRVLTYSQFLNNNGDNK